MNVLLHNRILLDLGGSRVSSIELISTSKMVHNLKVVQVIGVPVSILDYVLRTVIVYKGSMDRGSFTKHDIYNGDMVHPSATTAVV